MFTGVRSQQSHLEEYAIKVLRLERKIVELEKYATYRVKKISALEFENKQLKTQQDSAFAKKK